jgi:stage III sporulation protein AD
MQADVIKICATAVLCAVVGAVVGGLSGGVATAVRLCGLALVLGGALGLMGEIVRQTSVLGEGEAGEYVSLMLKGLGIVTVGRVSADVCRECGQTGVASAVETASRLAVLVLAMPSVLRLLDVVGELIERI